MSRVLRAHLREAPLRAPLGVSVVISLGNAEHDPIAAAAALRRALLADGWLVDLVFVDRGGADGSMATVAQFCRENTGVRSISLRHAGVGAALRAGILAAREELVVCEEGIGELDAHFHERALALLRRCQVDLVSGSQLLAGSMTEVSTARRVVERIRSWLLRMLVGFSGTDVHGSKAFRRTALLSVVQQCVIDGEGFTTELLVRARRVGLDVREIPVRVGELRPFSARCLSRIPHALWDLAKLTYVIHFRGRAS